METTTNLTTYHYFSSVLTEKKSSWSTHFRKIAIWWNFVWWNISCTTCMGRCVCIFLNDRFIDTPFSYRLCRTFFCSPLLDPSYCSVEMKVVHLAVCDSVCGVSILPHATIFADTTTAKSVLWWLCVWGVAHWNTHVNNTTDVRSLIVSRVS